MTLPPHPLATRTNIELQDDWTGLHGQLVEVRHPSVLARVGIVEDVTADGCVLWLAAEGAYTRTMFEKAGGYEVWMASEMPSQSPLSA